MDKSEDQPSFVPEQGKYMVDCEVGYRSHQLLPPFIVPLDIQSRRLARRGFNPAEALQLNDITSQNVRRAYLRRNLETTVNHVFEDFVVSFTNYYQLNAKGEMVTYPDNVVLHVDSDERGGLYSFGLRSAIGGALQNPNQLILLYSPPGPIVFDNNPNNKFREVKPYTIGQLYVMFSDGTKVHNVAIGISQEGESWLSQIIPDEYHDAKSRGDEIRTIKHFITHPTLLNVDIDTFLSHNWIDPGQVIYRNKDNVDFPLAQTLELIRKSLSHSLPRPKIVDKLMQETDIRHVTPCQIETIYETLAQRYMADRGLERMKLGGSCGGTEVSLGSPYEHEISNLSTDFRTLTQSRIERSTKTDKSVKYDFLYKPNHKCNKCGARGENTRLGPCDICEGCQKKFDSGEYQ